jgi:hypothetical protein
MGKQLTDACTPLCVTLSAQEAAALDLILLCKTMIISLPANSMPFLQTIAKIGQDHQQDRHGMQLQSS